MARARFVYYLCVDHRGLRPVARAYALCAMILYAKRGDCADVGGWLCAVCACSLVCLAPFGFSCPFGSFSLHSHTLHSYPSHPGPCPGHDPGGPRGSAPKKKAARFVSSLFISFSLSLSLSLLSLLSLLLLSFSSQGLLGRGSVQCSKIINFLARFLVFLCFSL